MLSDAEKRSLASSHQDSRRPHKTRSRIGAACIRCQKRKIRCDALLPACSPCQKAGTQCVGGGTSREIPRSYVNDLETRIEWLESVIRENIPDVDLGIGGDGRPDGAGVPPLKDSNVLPTPQENDPIQDDGTLGKLFDQIGLISVAAGADLRYLGPSSGLFFTRFVLGGLGKNTQIDKFPTLDSSDESFTVPPDLLVIQPKELPFDQRHTQWISQAYFESVHLQFPFLHEPTHMEIIRRMYGGDEVGPVCEFHVFMVLAIGATILSRRAKVMLSAEGYCASAISQLDSIFQSSSLHSIQCILLLEMYTLHNPSSGSLSHTRSHVVFQLRLMLKLPDDIDDGDLKAGQRKPREEGDPLTRMSSAIHLFKCARLNSEIKCVLYCVERQYPPYTQPTITDLEGWKVDILSRLWQWKEQIPQHPEGSPQNHMNLFCEIKYHELLMLVLRPNPRFQNPSKESVRECFSSAVECSKLYYRLYTTKSLHYSWAGIHSLFLCTIVICYCVWTPQGVADEADFDCLVQALKASSDVLSAMGEYWSEATRSRNIMDRISTGTIRCFMQKFNEMRSSSTP
ncbi:hypothetical protein F5884DRAFT_704125, partial [Xylogone sp. PMI_703]